MATINAVNTSLSGQSGSGSFAGTNGPTFTSPILGTPASGILSNCSGYPVASLTGLGTGIAAFLGTPSSANLAAALTDETGSGLAVFNNAPTFIAPILGAASATSIVFSSTSGIIGTTTNNAAVSGSVGEYISSQVTIGSAVPLTANVSINVTTISLTAGDWNVFGNILISGSSPGVNSFGAGINTTSATLTDSSLNAISQPAVASPFLAFGIALSPRRISLSATTTVYLVANATFSSTCSASGLLAARRVR